MCLKFNILYGEQLEILRNIQEKEGIDLNISTGTFQKKILLCWKIFNLMFLLYPKCKEY